MKLFLLAVSFLTTFPVRVWGVIQPGDLGKSGVWFTTVGLLIGGSVSLVYWAASLLLPGFPAAVTALTFWVVVSGGLHLDGLADCCDGLLNPSPPERRLEIMKDPRLGAFGVIGIALQLLFKISLLVEIGAKGDYLPLVLAAVLGRWFILIAAKQPMAKPGGMGADFAAGINGKIILLSGFIPLAGVIWLSWTGMISAAICAVMLFLLLRFCRSRIRGVTGDVFGMVVELTETTVLLCAVVVTGLMGSGYL